MNSFLWFFYQNQIDNIDFMIIRKTESKQEKQCTVFLW